MQDSIYAPITVGKPVYWTEIKNKLMGISSVPIFQAHTHTQHLKESQDSGSQILLEGRQTSLTW